MHFSRRQLESDLVKAVSKGFVRQRDRFRDFLPQVEHVRNSQILHPRTYSDMLTLRYSDMLTLTIQTTSKPIPSIYKTAQIILDNCSKYLRDVQKMRRERKP